MLDHDEIVRLYGLWKHRTPKNAAALLHSYPGQWWVAGGWAIDAFTGTSRMHADLDIGIPRESREQFINFVSPHFDVWAAAGSLTPLRPGSDMRLPPGCGNLWLRADGSSPWEYDVLLDHVHDGTWAYKRNPRLTRPLHDCLWVKNDITYLRPEVQLLLKAKHRRDKDTADLERCLPLLDPADRAWLVDALGTDDPAHPWIEQLEPPMNRS